MKLKTVLTEFQKILKHKLLQ